ncbi:MAG: sigma-70 family RNA polymerase sigma factor [Candidatus Dormiibacterota bacterium]
MASRVDLSEMMRAPLLMDEEFDRLASETGADPAATPNLRHELLELQPALLRFARSLTRDPDAAEDLAQEALTRALRFEDRFTPGTDAKAWLFTIARRLQQKRWRNDKRRPRVVSISDLGDHEDSFADEPISPLGVEAAVMSRFDRDKILWALQRLPTEQAVPLRLFAGEDMPYRQIAEILDIPLGTVMSRIFRGRRMLVKLLLEEGPP